MYQVLVNKLSGAMPDSDVVSITLTFNIIFNHCAYTLIRTMYMDIEPSVQYEL